MPALPAPSKLQSRVGVVTSVLVTLFLSMDSGVKLLNAKPAQEATTALGFPIENLPILGLLLLALVILYAVPRTAPIGAVLLTAWLGGAVAIHVRVGNPLFSHTLFPVYVGISMWVGLYLRDARIRALVRTKAGLDE